jgi:hypothetical protein
LGWGRSSWPNPLERRIGFFPRGRTAAANKIEARAQRHGVPTRATICFFNVLQQRLSGVIGRTQQRLNGKKQRKQKGPVVTEVQIAVPPFFVSLCEFLRCAKTIAEIMSVAVTGKAAEHRRAPKALLAKCYFGASEARIASNRGSPRSGSQSGLRRK